MISIIIPVYKEDQLYLNLKKFKNKLEKKFKNFEIIIINNGSDEYCLKEAKKITQEFTFVKNFVLKKANYGKAIEIGLRNSIKPISIILEFDFLDFKFVDSSVKKIVSKKIDMVIGSKTLKKSIDNRGLLRVSMTYIFNKLLSFFLKIKASDTHGLKAIEEGLRKKILLNCKSSSHAYQTEIVMIAEKFNFKIYEIPIVINEIRPTKLNIFFRVFTYLFIIKELYLIKKNYK